MSARKNVIRPVTPAGYTFAQLIAEANWDDVGVLREDLQPVIDNSVMVFELLYGDAEKLQHPSHALKATFDVVYGRRIEASKGDAGFVRFFEQLKRLSLEALEKHPLFSPSNISSHAVDKKTWSIYVITHGTADYGDKYVIREHVTSSWGSGPKKEPVAVVGTLAEARGAVPGGLVRIDRHPTDDPVIVESWM